MITTSLNILAKVQPQLKMDENDIQLETQNEAYEGFSVTSIQLRSRLAKQTPKKAGYFVTHYVSEPGEPNRPYRLDEAFETLAICIPKEGAFLFPKEVLFKQGILEATRNMKTKPTGKMGFRVYLPTEGGLNKTATKTQAWQALYYVSLEDV